MYSPRQVSDCILVFCRDHGDYISHLKLQKLLYYCQALYLAAYDKPMFEEDFEAWIHGPVLRSVYGTHRNSNWQPINPPDVNLDSFPPELVEHVQEVYRAYGNLSAFALEELTHIEDPWKNARAGLPTDVESRNLINKEEMRTYYKDRVINA